jgi:quinone-modifying oxidoreductase subunit QmoC
MAALRRECIAHYSVPRFMGRAAASPTGLLWVVIAATLLLGLAVGYWNGMGLGIRELALRSERIVMPFSPLLPHGLLMTLFGAVLLFDGVVLAVGLHRFWRALMASPCLAPTETRAEAHATPIWRVLRRVFWHHDFSRCTEEAPRRVSHTIVLYAMLALVLVDLWVITARYNPLRSGLVYPLGIGDPWKLLANLAGLALVVGCGLMTRDRLRRCQSISARSKGTYTDWLLLGLLLAVALTGFATEALHMLRLDGPRFWTYCVHLVTVLTFFALLPYSKLAHVGFRTLALIAAERVGQRQPVTALTFAPKEMP